MEVYSQDADGLDDIKVSLISPSLTNYSTNVKIVIVICKVLHVQDNGYDYWIR